MCDHCQQPYLIHSLIFVTLIDWSQKIIFKIATMIKKKIQKNSINLDLVCKWQSTVHIRIIISNSCHAVIDKKYFLSLIRVSLSFWHKPYAKPIFERQGVIFNFCLGEIFYFLLFVEGQWHPTAAIYLLVLITGIQQKTIFYQVFLSVRALGSFYTQVQCSAGFRMEHFHLIKNDPTSAC